MSTVSQYLTRNSLLLWGIFLLALFIRTVNLGSLPFDFHEDEVLSGFIGHFILQNGKDIYGNNWPLLYFNKFGDYYIILPIYLSGISTFIFGINEFATRFPSALFGSIAIFPVYLLAKYTFKNKTVGLLSAFFCAIAPWQIVLARSTSEGIIGSTIFLFGIISIILFVRKRNLWFLLLSVILFLVTYDIYHPFRFYTPFVYIPLLLLPDLRKNKKHLLYLLLTIFFFFGLSYYISTTFWGAGRFEQTSIFNQISGVSIKINEEISQDGQRNVSPLIAHVFHNKVLGYGREFLNQYLLYFSPILLFIDGWQGSRYVVPEQGIVYITFLLCIIAIFVIKKKTTTSIDTELMIYLLFLFVLAPAPAAFTVTDSPNFHRTAFMGYFIFIFAAYGFYKSFFVHYKKLSLGIIFSVFLLFEFIYFWHQYSINMDFASSVYRNDGQKQVAIYAGQQRANYDKIYLPQQGAMSWYYLFYNKDFSPSYIGRFQLDAKINNTGNINYIPNACPTTIIHPMQSEKIMAINRPECPPPSGWNQIASLQGINNLLTYKVYIPSNESPKK